MPPGGAKAVAPPTSPTMYFPSPQPNFVGQIQQLYFNGVYLIDMARSGQLSSVNVTAKFGSREQSIHHPVNFKSKHTYVGLPQLKAYSSTNIYFQFKTLEPKGIILYNAGKGQDFISIELVGGHIHYVVNLGDGPIRIRDNLRNSLNDNRWHSVTIGRPGPRQHTLMVDDSISTVVSQGNNENLDLNGILYLGNDVAAPFLTTSNYSSHPILSNRWRSQRYVQLLAASNSI